MNMRRTPRGFTLIELVIVIVLASIVAGVTAVFIAAPMRAYVDQERRAELVDAAEMAMRRMARDIRRAVPNSVRVAAGGQAIEMLNALEGARYRAGPPPGGQENRLRFNTAETAFNVFGPLHPATQAGTLHLAIYHFNQSGADAYAFDPVITPPGTTFSFADLGNGETRVNLDPGHQFAFESPSRRVFFVDGAISYQCESGAGTLRRAAYTNFGAAPPSDASMGALVSRHVTGCQFRYDPGSATRSGLVTLQLSLTRDGETVTLLHQVHSENAP